MREMDTTSYESHFNEPLVICALATHQNPDSLNLRYLELRLPTNIDYIWILRLNVWATKGTRFRHLSHLFVPV
jgi:hypothetical protein